MNASTNELGRTSLVRCPLCLSEQFEDISARRWVLAESTFGRKRCHGCGVVVADPLPSESDLHTVYSGLFDYNWYSRVGLMKQLQAILRIRALRRHVGSGTKSLIEIGCGHGFFLKWAKRSGFAPIGVEISSGRYALSRADPSIPVLSLEELVSQQQTYDVICLWHSLEHFREPVVLLGTIRSMLTPGGVLAIAIPNARSLTKRLRNLVGKDWIWDQEPYIHVWHFDPSNISRLLSRTRFHPTKIECKDTWDANLVADGLYALGLAFIVKYLKKWPFRGAGSRFALDQMIRLFGVMFVPLLNPVLKRIQAGNEMVIYSDTCD